MKKRKQQIKHLKKANALLIEALERAYGDALSFLNYGDFKKRVVWDAGYIEDALAFARKQPKRKDEHENRDFDFDDYES